MQPIVPTSSYCLIVLTTKWASKKRGIASDARLRATHVTKSKQTWTHKSCRPAIVGNDDGGIRVLGYRDLHI